MLCFHDVCFRRGAEELFVTGEACVFSLWGCEGREDFRIHLYPGAWSFGTSDYGRIAWANKKGDFNGQFWRNKAIELQQGDALGLLFTDGSLSREQNTMGEPDHFEEDGNEKSSQAKRIFRLAICLCPSDGSPLLPCLIGCEGNWICAGQEALSHALYWWESLHLSQW